MNVPTEVMVSIVGVLGVVVTAMSGVMIAKINAVGKQVHNNGGSSLKDVVDSIHEKVIAVQDTAHTALHVAERSRDWQEDHDSKDEARFDMVDRRIDLTNQKLDVLATRSGNHYEPGL